MQMIYIIRHGQTRKNKAHALQGRSDDLLNAEGKEQVRKAGRLFKENGITFDLIYSSPLQRAIDTVKIVDSQTPIRIDERLIEMDYGPYEGMDLTNPLPEIVTFFSDFVHNPAPEGMEQLPDVVKRAGAFLEEIKKEAEGKNVLISTHAIAMKGLLEYLMPKSQGSWWSRFIGNCAIYQAELKDGKYGLPYEMRPYPDYSMIDMDTWPRREHFRYYQEKIPCSHSMTVDVDVTHMLDYARSNKIHFSACLLYAVSKAVNELDSARLMTDQEGNPGTWETVNPVFTVFHQDDHTFSDLWMDYKPDFESFLKEYDAVVRIYGDEKGIKGRPGQPANFFCFSCAPFTSYRSYSCCATASPVPPLFPIIDCGKYTKIGDRYLLPAALTISHAAMDGWHLGQFFERLQEYVDEIGK